jgi:hypothetical protein
MEQHSSSIATAEVFAEYGLILIKAPPGEVYVEPPHSTTNGLVAARTDAVAIWTSVHTGPVAVTVQLTDVEPPWSARGWEQVEQVELISTSDDMRVMGFMGAAPEELPSLTGAGPGHYGLRVHARKRGPGPSRAQEEYLLMVWPVELGEAAVQQAGGQEEELSPIVAWARANRSPANAPGRL